MESIALSTRLIEHLKISDHYHVSHGGQKTVFIVTIDEIRYALKIIHFVDERFVREVKISDEFGSIKGIPSIVRVEQIGKKTIILEEYITGEDLTNKLDQYIGNESAVCRLIIHLAEIMEPVWQKRYVHRDLKPQNIRIGEDGIPVILDFGIARALDEESITATGSQPLSWLFAAPEQYNGRKELISYRTDFFSLGIIAYRLFTGRLPFGDNKAEIEKCFLQKHNWACESTLLTKFYNQVLKINASERPGRIESFINLLKI